LPHRYPFLLLDRVENFVPGQRARGWLRLTAGGRMLAQDSRLPLVFLVEACAQLTALAAAPANTADTAGGEAGAGIGYLAAVEGFQVKRLPAVGDTVVVEVRIERRLGRLLQVACELWADDEALGGGRLTVTAPA
jgi:3-hydroxyacyl-[acyl-carrier-protein] dehydratase